MKLKIHKVLFRVIDQFKLYNVIIFLFSGCYRKSYQKCSDLLLTLLGISNLTLRNDFYTIDRIITSIDNFDGAIIECGTFKGFSLLGMAHVLKKKGLSPKIYGLDSFEGFPKPTKEDELEDGSFHKITYKGSYNDTSLNLLTKKIKAYGFSSNVSLTKGFFEDTLINFKDEKFKFVHLDGDLYDSYKVCLEFLYDKILPGGYMVFDDYISESVFPGAKKAVDEFFLNKPEKVELFAEAKYPRCFIKKQ